MSQLTIMTIILMGTKMMSMGMSIMLMVTQTFKYEEKKLKLMDPDMLLRIFIVITFARIKISSS